MTRSVSTLIKFAIFGLVMAVLTALLERGTDRYVPPDRRRVMAAWILENGKPAPELRKRLRRLAAEPAAPEAGK